MKIYIDTLGCKVNQYESQALETVFAARGHEIGTEAAGCDAVVLNSCAVTAESVRKSRQALRRLMAEAPGAVVALCGCWPQTEPENAAKLGADVLFGSGDRLALADAVEEAVASRKKRACVDDALKRRAYEALPAGNLAGRTRALLKIEDGCVNFCAYCIIPYARGPVRSLPLADVAAEAAALAARGYREIVITGIEIASYGRDLKTADLTDAVAAAAEAAPNVRIRLGSLEPRVITEAFCRRLAALPNVCPHFHLSLQSGCDATLRRMNRKYDTDRFYESVRLLRDHFDNCGVTTDLITGFPGETDAEFAQTLAFIRKCAFSGMHIFPYSVRKGTAAAAMPDQLDRAVKAERAAEAKKLAETMRRDFLLAQTGRTLPVLFETERDGVWQGHAGNYALVRAAGSELKNREANVLITAVKNGALFGKISL